MSIQDLGALGEFLGLFLVLATLVGAALRLYQLGEWSVWVDEAHTWRDATMPLDGERGFMSADRRFYPLPFFLLRFLLGVGVLGYDEWSIRLPFAIFGIRLFQLQIIEGADLRSRSELNSVRTVRIEAPRGEIVDREGRALAASRVAFGVSMIPKELRDRDSTMKALGMLIAIQSHIAITSPESRDSPATVAPGMPAKPRPNATRTTRSGCGRAGFMSSDVRLILGLGDDGRPGLRGCVGSRIANGN